MDALSSQQIITVIVFLAALVAVWFWVSQRATTLRTRFGQGKRVIVQDITPLGPQERALILSVDAQEYLVVQSKKAAPAIMPIPAKEGSE